MRSNASVKAQTRQRRGRRLEQLVGAHYSAMPTDTYATPHSNGITRPKANSALPRNGGEEK